MFSTSFGKKETLSRKNKSNFNLL